MKKVGVLMGSDSDLPVVRKALDTLRAFGVPYEVHVYSAHRTPTQAQAFCSSTLPVIGIPMASGGLGGMDALLSTVQMPSGIPVATVAVNGAANAAILAVQILAVEEPTLADKLAARRASDREKVLEKNQAVENEFNL